MSRYIDVDTLLNNLPDDLPYKASVKRVLIQAPTADVAPIADTVREFAERLKTPLDAVACYWVDKIAKEMEGEKVEAKTNIERG